MPGSSDTGRSQAGIQVSNRYDPRHTGGVPPADRSAAQTAGAAPAATAKAGFVALIGSLTLMPAVATDMYLPSLPQVEADLGTTVAGAQFTITGMVLGGALGQLVMGPFSDRVGRRLPALLGLGLHAALSLFCAFAPTIGLLAGLRVLQGLVAAGATVAAIAAIRDRFAGAEAARLLSRLMLVIAVAPLLAPSVGSAVAAVWGWRAVFVVLAVVAALLALVAALALPETLPVERRQRQGAAGLARGYRALLGDRRFVALAVVPGLGMAVIMGYVAGSPFVLQVQHGLTAGQFSAVFAVGGLVLVAATQTNAALVRRLGPARLLRAGVLGALIAAIGLLVVAVLDVGGVAGLLTPLWLTMGALGFVGANASALAMTRHGERAGTAAATIGFVQAGVAGAVSPLVGLLGGDAVAMAAVILASCALAFAVLALATPAYRRDGWIALGADGLEPDHLGAGDLHLDAREPDDLHPDAREPGRPTTPLEAAAG